MTAATTVAPREAYGLWAATYDEENVVSTLDEAATTILSPRLAGRSLLDAGCGTGRRLTFDKEAPRFAAGVDLTFEMLAQSRGDRRRSQALAVADIRSIPVAGGAFEVVWCRLAAGHVRELGAVYRELSRVVSPGGCVIVTDFHPDAARAGHVRSFRDASGATRVVDHYVHELRDHDAAAESCGLGFDARLELGVERRVRHFYERAGALARYESDLGLRLLLALRYRR